LRGTGIADLNLGSSGRFQTIRYSFPPAQIRHFILLKKRLRVLEERFSFTLLYLDIKDVFQHHSEHASQTGATAAVSGCMMITSHTIVRIHDAVLPEESPGTNSPRIVHTSG
jgi:hypothetical protein